MKDKGISFNFHWFFAIIVGAVIIFLAIYGVSKLIGTSEYYVDTEAAKQLTIVLDPMEVGIASAKKSKVELSSEIRIENRCFEENTFGMQKVAVSSFQRGSWSEGGVAVEFKNKYLFSDKFEEGKEFHFFSKPFEFPFKISELIYMYSEDYCFLSPPNVFKEDVEDLSLENIMVVSDENMCPVDSKKVCFNNGGCDISIYDSCNDFYCDAYDYGYVERGGNKFYYVGSLVYGGIFSDEEIYECNVQRLMKRLKQISGLYAEEVVFLGSQGCGTNLGGGLLDVARNSDIESSRELLNLRESVEDLEELNNAAECELW